MAGDAHSPAQAARAQPVAVAGQHGAEAQAGRAHAVVLGDGDLGLAPRRLERAGHAGARQPRPRITAVVW
jgi:threonine dehydrogenase-like Zn-dependent dehydrogenase